MALVEVLVRLNEKNENEEEEEDEEEEEAVRNERFVLSYVMQHVN